MMTSCYVSKKGKYMNEVSSGTVLGLTPHVSLISLMATAATHCSVMNMAASVQRLSLTHRLTWTRYVSDILADPLVRID